MTSICREKITYLIKQFLETRDWNEREARNCNYESRHPPNLAFHCEPLALVDPLG